jgi:hypothetical protein
MMAHARLQPSASNNIRLTLPRLAPNALKAQVSVRTIMSPNKNSEILSMGSKMRSAWVVGFADIFNRSFAIAGKG